MATLTEAVEERLREQAGAAAVLWNDRTLSFAELAAWSGKLAGGIVGKGIAPGDRVAVALPNSPQLIATVLGVLRAGAVLVPVNPASTTAEARYIIGDAGATLVITDPDWHRKLAATDLSSRILTVAEALYTTETDLVRRQDQDAALIVYTSGTTGQPKGAVLSQHALCSNLSTVAEAWRWTPQDRLLLTLPCFHLYGLALGILGSLLVGSSIVLRPRFVADEVPALLSRHRCSLFFGVPTMYNRLLLLSDTVLAGADLGCMRLWLSGSAPLTEATFERFKQRFGHDILERFGMSEGGFMIAAPYDGPRRPGVVGYPLPGIEVDLVDPDAADKGTLVRVAQGEAGEIVIRGPNLFSGYWQRSEDTRQAFVGGYFRSGDLALREPDGMIRIVGRRSVDIIKSRGFKISAVEIENCLQAHPAVAEVAVIGVPDPDRGEVVLAVVTLAGPASVSAEVLRDFAREHLAPYKVPAQILFLDEIPRTGPGKFKKRELIERFAATQHTSRHQAKEPPA